MTVNGKVSHRKLGEAVASLTETVNQHAAVINGQVQRTRAYGERLADVLVRLDKLEQMKDANG